MIGGPCAVSGYLALYVQLKGPRYEASVDRERR